MSYGLGITQQRISSQPIPISGRRLLSSLPTTTLPPSKIVAGAIPAGYEDHGSILAGAIELSIDITKDVIALGRIPSPKKQYITGQSGVLKMKLQEFQPEIISFSTSFDSNVSTGLGYSYVYLGGKMSGTRRVLIFDDFDVDLNDGFHWAQFWWTNPYAQFSGSFALQDDKLATVIPYEIYLKDYLVSQQDTLLEFRAIDNTYSPAPTTIGGGYNAYRWNENVWN